MRFTERHFCGFVAKYTVELDASDSVGKAIILDSDILGASPQRTVVAIKAKYEGATWYYVNEGTPISTSTAAGPERVLRPMEISTESGRWTQSRSRAIVVKNANVAKANKIEVFVGIGSSAGGDNLGDAGQRYIVDINCETRDMGPWTEVEAWIDVTWGGQATAPALRDWECKSRWKGSFPPSRIFVAPVNVSLTLNPQTADPSNAINTSDRRTCYIMQTDSALDLTWNGASVENFNFWLNTDSEWTDNIAIVSSPVPTGSGLWIEGEDEDDVNVLKQGTSTTEELLV